MNPIERSFSLPKLRETKKIETRKNKQLQIMNKKTIKRLYNSDLKKLKTKENSFWFKSFADRRLEKQMKELRK